MENNDRKKKQVLKFAKIYSVVLVIAGIVYSYAVYAALEILSRGTEFLATRNLSQSEIKFNIIFFILVAMYCLIGGFGLYKSKKWAFYFVVGIGIFIFFVSVFRFLTSLDFNVLGITDIVLGVTSIYFIRNRRYFEK
ncbi:MAG: hypothetical protein NTZ49_03185 [Candidatus Parcubacteria bacterium]|nr:hypothetical protein [Candidatus Parcubacteria bacterium]